MVRLISSIAFHLRAAKSLENQKATLLRLHDDIASLKAEWDADKKLSNESLFLV